MPVLTQTRVSTPGGSAKCPLSFGAGGPGRFCDLCGAMRLEGPEEMGGQAREQAAALMEAPAALLPGIGSPSSVRMAHGDGWEQSPAKAS